MNGYLLSSILRWSHKRVRLIFAQQLSRRHPMRLPLQ